MKDADLSQALYGPRGRVDGRFERSPHHNQVAAYRALLKAWPSLTPLLLNLKEPTLRVSVYKHRRGDFLAVASKAAEWDERVAFGSGPTPWAALDSLDGSIRRGEWKLDRKARERLRAAGFKPSG